MPLVIPILVGSLSPALPPPPQVFICGGSRCYLLRKYYLTDGPELPEGGGGGGGGGGMSYAAAAEGDGYFVVAGGRGPTE